MGCLQKSWEETIGVHVKRCIIGGAVSNAYIGAIRKTMNEKVWILNHYATEMFQNKGQRHYWFADNLKKSGFEPLIFCSNQFHNINSCIELNGARYREEQTDSIPFIFVKSSPYKGNGTSRVFNMLSFARNSILVSKQVAREHGKPDVILASSVHPLTLVAGLIIARRFKIPCICEIRDLWPEAIFSVGKVTEKSLLGKLLVAGEHWIYRNADALIFTKEGDTDYLKEHKWDTAQGGDIDLKKCHYINNGVDLEAFEKKRQENILEDEDLTSDQFLAVYTGAVRPVNNVGFLLDTAKLLQNHKDVKLLIYGAGIELERLQKRVQDEQITNVTFKGLVNKKYIPFILSHASVNLLNYSANQYNWSRGNSSNKLFEYMASGKPVISTVKMGYCILERYHCGFSIAHYTPEELAEAILKVKHMTPEEYDTYSRNAKQAVQEFDFKVLTQKLIDVISEVLPN